MRESWINFVKRDSNKPGIILFDYLSGINVDIIGQKHPKKINRATSGAKLLSCNDKSEFTFRGRFAEQNDAIIVDYAQSQKMHQTLRWLIANYGYAVDSQVIVTWAVDNNTEVKARAQDNSYDLFGEMEEIKTNADVLAAAVNKHAERKGLEILSISVNVDEKARYRYEAIVLFKKPLVISIEQANELKAAFEPDLNDQGSKPTIIPGW